MQITFLLCLSFVFQVVILSHFSQATEVLYEIEFSVLSLALVKFHLDDLSRMMMKTSYH